MERKHLTKFWPGQVSEHCVLIGQWGQTTQLIIYETNNGNLEIASVPVLGKREGHFIWESRLGQMEKGGSSQEAVSQTHKMGASLNCCCFPGAQGQKAQHCQLLLLLCKSFRCHGITKKNGENANCISLANGTI